MQVDDNSPEKGNNPDLAHKAGCFFIGLMEFISLWLSQTWAGIYSQECQEQPPQGIFYGHILHYKPSRRTNVLCFRTDFFGLQAKRELLSVYRNDLGTC